MSEVKPLIPLDFSTTLLEAIDSQNLKVTRVWVAASMVFVWSLRPDGTLDLRRYRFMPNTNVEMLCEQVIERVQAGV